MGLDIVELVIEVETVFGIQIPNEDAKRLETVGLLFDYVGRRIAPSIMMPEGGPYTGELWERFLDVVEKESGARRERLTPDARFVYDLGLD
jgi:acyl carrier protein